MKNRLVLCVLAMLWLTGCEPQRVEHPPMPTAADSAAAEERIVASLARMRGLLKEEDSIAVATAVLEATLKDTGLLPLARVIQVCDTLALLHRAQEERQGEIAAQLILIRHIDRQGSSLDTSLIRLVADRAHNVANRYASLGMQPESRRHARYAITKKEQLDGPRSASALKSYTTLGLTFKNEGRHDSAAAYLGIVTRARERSAVATAKERFIAHNNLAEVQLYQELAAEAGATIASQAQDFAALSASEQAQYFPYLQDLQVRHAMLVGDLSAAQRLLSERAPGPVAKGIASFGTLIMRGDLARAIGHPEEAVVTYRTALEQVVPKPAAARIASGSFPSTLQLGSDPNAVLALTRMARATAELRDSASRDGTWELWDSAFALVDAMRVGFGNEAWRADISAQSIKEADFAIWLASRNGRPLNAWNWIEYAKENELLDILQDQGRHALAPISADTLGRAQSLLQSRDQALNAGDIAQASVLQRQLDTLVAATLQSHPGRIRIRPQVAAAEKLRQFLRGDTVVFLNYLWGPKHLAIGACSKDVDTVMSIDIDEGLREAITTYGFHLTHRSALRHNDPFADCSYEIYSRIVQPSLKAIGLTAPPKRLIVSANGSLGTIPFEALLTEPVPSETHYSQLPYLLRNSVISYAQSATMWVELQAQRPAAKGVLGIGASGGYQGTQLLPSLAGEVREVVSLLGGQSHTDIAAAEALVKQSQDGYGILHLAAHGSFDSHVPLMSHLILQGRSEGGEDGLLHAYEVMQLKLDRQMAVLSACESGRHEPLNGREPVSMGYAFHLANCPTVLMSLWKTEDESSRQIMSSFYDHIARGEEVALAFSHARREYLETAAPEAIEPFFWAPYIITGNGELTFGKAEDEQAPSYWLLIGAALFGSMIAVLAWFRKRSANRGSF